MCSFSKFRTPFDLLERLLETISVSRLDPYLITERKERTGLQPNLTGESRTGIINLSQDTPLDLTQSDNIDSHQEEPMSRSMHPYILSLCYGIFAH